MRCIRGYEEKLRIAIVTLTSVAERRITRYACVALELLLQQVSGNISIEAKKRSPPLLSGQEYTARRYQGQKVDLQEKGINRQELLFLTQDDLEGMCSHRHIYQMGYDRAITVFQSGWPPLSGRIRS